MAGASRWSWPSRCCGEREGAAVGCCKQLRRWLRQVHLAPPSTSTPHTCCSLARRAVDEGTNPDTWAVQLFRDSMAANQIRRV